MEDFGTILWVVVVVGIMVTNLVTKSRKARGKGSPHTGEAWPSMEEVPRRQEGMPESAGQPRPDAQSDTQPASRQPAGWPEIPGFPGIPTAPGSRRAADPTVQPRTKAFGADPSHRSTPDNITTRQAAQCEIRATNVPKSANSTAAPQSEPVETREEGILGEEFDLRKAVIYSEILRPKFRE